MRNDPNYTSLLEDLIKNELLPACKIYYKSIGKEVPRTDWLLGTKKIPALLDKNFGVSVATSNVQKPRKN
jgi:hypothetical protein